MKNNSQFLTVYQIINKCEPPTYQYPVSKIEACPSKIRLGLFTLEKFNLF